MTQKPKLYIGVLAGIFLVMLAALAIAVSHDKHQANSRNQANAVTKQASATAEQQREGFAHEATVEITDDGFLPATLSVANDTRVYFENKTTSQHSLIPDSVTRKAEPELGFEEEKDTTQAIAPGGGYAYSFHHSGTFHIHDGFKPTDNVTVVVQ